MNLEPVLNDDLPRYQVTRGQRKDGHDAFVISFPDYPQCRAEGRSLADALREARLYFDAIRDCRVAWKIDELLAASSPEEVTRPDVSPQAPDADSS
jgi:hypothetical protein